jgi:hypothetical protein
MLEFTDLEACASRSAEPDCFVALDTSAKLCFSSTKSSGDGLSLIGEDGPEVGRLRRVSRVRLWPPHLNGHRGNITGLMGRVATPSQNCHSSLCLKQCSISATTATADSYIRAAAITPI